MMVKATIDSSQRNCTGGNEPHPGQKAYGNTSNCDKM